MAVDRSLFGPQGRRWIERKLPDVACNIAFVAVSAFGACMLMFYVSLWLYLTLQTLFVCTSCCISIYEYNISINSKSRLIDLYL